MSSENIERFNEITGRVFALLYSSFPVPLDLDATMIGIPRTGCSDFSENGERSELGGLGFIANYQPSEEEEFFTHCVSWLIETGYLSGQIRPASETHRRVVLTAKGLEVLKAVPSAIKDGSSLGEQLKEAAKTDMVEKVKDLTNQALSFGVGLAIQTVKSSLGM